MAKNGSMVLVHGFDRLVHIKSDHDMVYIISLLNIIIFTMMIDHIRVIRVIRFPKLFCFSNLLYDATLCNRLFPNAEGMIKNTSTRVNHSHQIPVYTNHSDVGKKLERNINTISV